MTTPAEIRARIEDLSVRLVSGGIAVAFNPPLVLRQGGSSRVTWSRSPALSELFGRFATIAEYRKYVRENEFSVMLVDGALLQLSYVLERDEVVGHRLGYFPCPIVFDAEEAAEFTVEELLDATGEDWQERVRLRTPIRFDFDPGAARTDHPSSHMTISEECCRIAVHAPISVGHFVRFVFRNFYPSWWSAHAFLRELAIEQFTSTLDVESDNLFMSWRRPS